jgi:hypothetical protein
MGGEKRVGGKVKSENDGKDQTSPRSLDFFVIGPFTL